MLDEVLDRGDQFRNVLVDAAANLLFGEDREPDLAAQPFIGPKTVEEVLAKAVKDQDTLGTVHYVHPRGAGRGEVEVHALVAPEPGLTSGVECVEELSSTSAWWGSSL